MPRRAKTPLGRSVQDTGETVPAKAGPSAAQHTLLSGSGNPEERCRRVRPLQGRSSGQGLLPRYPCLPAVILPQDPLQCKIKWARFSICPGLAAGRGPEGLLPGRQDPCRAGVLGRMGRPRGVPRCDRGSAGRSLRTGRAGCPCGPHPGRTARPAVAYAGRSWGLLVAPGQSAGRRGVSQPAGRITPRQSPKPTRAAPSLWQYARMITSSPS